MTIRMLKELIKDLPDDMRIYADDGSNGMFSDNNEFLTFATHNGMCVFQTREDFDTAEELNAWCKWAAENDYDELDFWMEFVDRGYVPADFSYAGHVDEVKEEMAHRYLADHGLI